MIFNEFDAFIGACMIQNFIAKFKKSIWFRIRCLIFGVKISDFKLVPESKLFVLFQTEIPGVDGKDSEFNRDLKCFKYDELCSGEYEFIRMTDVIPVVALKNKGDNV